MKHKVDHHRHDHLFQVDQLQTLLNRQKQETKSNETTASYKA